MGSERRLPLRLVKTNWLGIVVPGEIKLVNRGLVRLDFVLVLRPLTRNPAQDSSAKRRRCCGS